MRENPTVRNFFGFDWVCLFSIRLWDYDSFLPKDRSGVETVEDDKDKVDDRLTWVYFFRLDTSTREELRFYVSLVLSIIY